MANKSQIISKTPAEIVTALFDFIEHMGTGPEDGDVSEDEFMANVCSDATGISFDGYGSSPFIDRTRLEEYLLKKLKS